MLPSFLPSLTTEQVGPKVNFWGEGEFCRHHFQTSNKGQWGGDANQNPQNPCLQLCTQSQGLGRVARKQGLCM